MSSRGGAGNDTIDGGAGDDVILDTQGGTLAGGAGNDRFYIHELGDGSIDGGSGTDTAWIVGGGSPQYGNGVRIANGNVLGNTASALSINTYLQELAGGAAYIITQQWGNPLYHDVAIVDVEEVNVDGGLGNDLVVYLNGTQYFGGAATDTFAANWRGQTAAINWSLATTNATTLANGVTVGGFERAHLLLGSGNDAVTGGNSSDYLDGGAGSDTLAGGGGNNTLIGGAGNDVIEGGSGNDRAVFSGAFGIDLIYNSSGTLTAEFTDVSFTGLSYSRSGEHLIIRVMGTSNYAVLVDYFSAPANWSVILNGSVEAIDPSSIANGTLPLGPIPLLGTALDDIIELTASEAAVQAGGGDDLIRSGAEQHAIDGGEGQDLVDYSGSATGVTVNLSNGTGSSGDAEGDTFTSVENVIGSSEADTLIGNGDSNFVAGGGGDDSISTGSGSDVVVDGDGADLINLGSGEDIVILTGSSYHTNGYVAFNVSSDTQVGTQVRINLEGLVRIEAVTDGGADADIVQLSDEGDVFFLHDAYSRFHSSIALTEDYVGNESIARFANIEEIRGMGGNDIIDLTSPDYSLAGIAMSIDGGEGNDVIWGSDADENISSGSGNDTIFGGSGNNILTGGAGADVFEFTRTSTDTSVSDFDISEGDTLRFYNAGGAVFDASSVVLTDIGILIHYIDSASGTAHDISIDLASSANDFSSTLPEILSALEIL